MPIILPCDILVVGAGPAGSSAAAAAAKGGVRTLLIDSKSRIGEPPHCGEFVPRRLFAENDLDPGCVIQKVEVMETRIIGAREPDPIESLDPAKPVAADKDRYHNRRVLQETSSYSPGFIIDRVRFDRDLAKEAAVSGATVLCSTRLVGRDGDSWVLSGKWGAGTIKPRFVIAADGPVSAVAAALGMRRQECLRGVQVEVPLRGPSDRCLVFLDQDFIGGYGWLFPKGKSANVGVGVTLGSEVSPATLMEDFVERLATQGTIHRGRLASSSGLIPVGGLRPELVTGNVVFCGDAAGLTHPITGAGIPQAVLSGRLAGGFVAEAVRTGADRPLREYSREIKMWYGGVIAHALAKRNVMTKQWMGPDFQALCEQAWIGFRGYRQRAGR